MFERDNRIYYERRSVQAAELGDRATDPKIAALHYELALRYALLSVQGNQTKFEIVGADKELTSLDREPIRAWSMGEDQPEIEMALQQA